MDAGEYELELENASGKVNVPITIKVIGKLIVINNVLAARVGVIFWLYFATYCDRSYLGHEGWMKKLKRFAQKGTAFQEIRLSRINKVVILVM